MEEMEDTDSTKKRSCSAMQNSSMNNEDPCESSQKRSRNHAEQSKSTSPSIECNTTDDNFDSVEEMLSVPVHVLFRKLPENGKPLLSRSEASCFVQIQKLAHQIDILTNISAQTLHQKIQFQTMADSLEAVDHPHLRPLFLLLRISANVEDSIHRIRCELTHVFHQLDVAANHLARYSEQNYTLADDIQEFSEALAAQKRKLSELQEEVKRRIQTYFLNKHVLNDSGHSIPPSDQCSFPPPLREYCRRLFDEPEHMADFQQHSPIWNNDKPQSDNACTTTKLSTPTHPPENHNNINDVDPPSSSSSAITSPRASPEPEDLTEPDHTQQRISTAHTPQTDNLTNRRVSIKMASKTNALLDEKENTPSQPSSSQNSQSQSLLDTHYSVVDDSFKSQAAAEVLSMLASSSTTKKVWSKPKTNQESAMAESPSLL